MSVEKITNTIEGKKFTEIENVAYNEPYSSWLFKSHDFSYVRSKCRIKGYFRMHNSVILEMMKCFDFIAIKRQKYQHLHAPISTSLIYKEDLTLHKFFGKRVKRVGNLSSGSYQESKLFKRAFFSLNGEKVQCRISNDTILEMMKYFRFVVNKKKVHRYLENPAYCG